MRCTAIQRILFFLFLFNCSANIAFSQLITPKTPRPPAPASPSSFIPKPPSVFGNALITPFDTLILLTATPTDPPKTTGKLYLAHRLKRGQTLFQLSEFYKVSVANIQAANPAMAKGTAAAAGQFCYIPITKNHIERLKPKTYAWKNYTRVLYKVKVDETLFRVAKTYLDVPADSIRVRNGLKTDAVSPNKMLHIGWIAISGVPKLDASADTAKVVARPVIDPNSPLYKALIGSERLKMQYLKTKFLRRETLEKGVAYWDNKDRSMLRLNAGFFALHNTIPAGTTVKVYNPMSRRTIYVNILGRIPESVSPMPDILLSPFTAKTLGAIDCRFHIEVSYLK